MEAMGGGERGVDGSYIMTLGKSEKLSPRRGDVSGKNLKLVTGQTSTCSCNHKAVAVKTGAPKLQNGKVRVKQIIKHDVGRKRVSVTDMRRVDLVR